MHGRPRILIGVVVLVVGLLAVRDALADQYTDAFPSAQVREYFYADDSGFVYRGGIALRDPLGVAAKQGQIVDLRLEGPRDLCGMQGLWGNYQALFNLEFIEDAFVGLVNNVAEAAIWAAFCSAEPVLCDLVKHMRAMARTNLNARLAQCHTVQNAAATYGRTIWEESHKQCLEEKKAQGLAIDQAMEACGAKTLPLVDYLGKKVERLEVVGAALDTVGASDETKTLAKDILGEVTFSAGGETTRTGHGVGRVAAKYEQLADDKEREVLEILNRLHESGTVTQEDLDRLSTPSLPMTPRHLLTLARLPNGDRHVAALRLARALAMHRLMTQVKAVQEYLQAARKTPGGEPKAQALEVELRDLDRQLDTLARHKQLEEEFVVSPMLAVIKEQAMEEQLTASRLAPGGSSDLRTRTTRDGEHLMGNFGAIEETGE